MFQRRHVLQSLLGAMTTAALPAGGAGGAWIGAAFAAPAEAVQLGPPTPFSRAALLAQVEQRASKPFTQVGEVSDPWKNLTYDQYRGINFDPDKGLWKNTDRPFVTEFFAPGLYFPRPISVSIVEGGSQRAVQFDKALFVRGPVVPDLPNDETLGFAGFRLRATINDPERKDEFVVFQGASYFRAVGKGHAYGLSARGLALNTGEPEGEEFPDFRTFWIEKPDPGAKMITVHALMDSPSVAGLYTFKITPGDETEMDVSASLFPRVDLTHAGIAAETSMFLFDETNRNRFDDFRPAVHDSDGLLIDNGRGERLWRPLANPKTLQKSSFVDTNPRGFGLMQRPRELAAYGDLEANYHRRPGLWVVPGEGWGEGFVTLVEIPADKEIYDNIVAYWRPKTPLAAGQRHDFNYRLLWSSDPVADNGLARVTNTKMGKRIFKDGRVAAIEFTRPETMPNDLAKFTVHTSANRGTVEPGILQHNPATGGLRLTFAFLPKDRSEMELRAQLLLDGKAASEVWLYRWTK
ncbi:MAG: glucan biosynthesis protein G [Pseudomonadota bacterium]